MDELELLKKDWKKHEGNYPRLSYDQIYKMIWKKSSSIVKWIFVISVIEFLFWTLLTIFFADNEYWNLTRRLHLMEFTIVSYIINYGITFYFIYRFYKNYKKISSTDNVSELMKNIIKTRKTVKYYIAYVLISTLIISIVMTYFIFHYHSLNTTVEDVTAYTFTTTQWLMFLAGVLIIMLIFLGLLWLFYRILYGILLKRLHRNYKELQKLEME